MVGSNGLELSNIIPNIYFNIFFKVLKSHTPFIGAHKFHTQILT